MSNIYLAFPTVPMLYNTKHAICAAHFQPETIQRWFLQYFECCLSEFVTYQIQHMEIYCSVTVIL